MIVDCGECTVRGDACSDCVVSVLLGVPGMPAALAGGPRDAPFATRRMRLEQDEQEAMAVLAESGLVPRLRLVGREIPSPQETGHDRPAAGPEHAAG